MDLWAKLKFVENLMPQFFLDFRIEFLSSNVDSISKLSFSSYDFFTVFKKNWYNKIALTHE